MKTFSIYFLIILLILLLFYFCNKIFFNKKETFGQSINSYTDNEKRNIRKLLNLLQTNLVSFYKMKLVIDSKLEYILKNVYKNKDNTRKDTRKDTYVYNMIIEFLTSIESGNIEKINYFLKCFKSENYEIKIIRKTSGGYGLPPIIPQNLIICPELSAHNEKDKKNKKNKECKPPGSCPAPDDNECEPPGSCPAPDDECKPPGHCPAPDDEEHFTNMEEKWSEHEEFNKKLTNSRKRVRDIMDGNSKKNFTNNISKLKNSLKGETTEHFINSSTLHKHTDTGQISFQPTGVNDIDDEWLKDPKNLKLLDDYKFIPNSIKTDLYKETLKIDNNLQTANTYLEELFKKYDNMLTKDDNNKLFVELRKKIKSAGYEDIEKEYIEEIEKDKIQDKKLKEINNKIKQLEDKQNNINENNKDLFNSIKSFNDGQVISIINHKDNDVKVKVNDGCLSYNKGNFNIGSCQSNNKSSLFTLNQIKNTNEFNKHLKQKVTEEEGIIYPFHLLNPKNDKNNGKNKCLNMDKLRVSVTDCKNEDKYKWDSLKTSKRCGKFN